MPDLSGWAEQLSGPGISGTVEFGRAGSPGEPGVRGGASGQAAGCDASSSMRKGSPFFLPVRTRAF